MKQEPKIIWPEIQGLLENSEAALWGLADLSGLSAPPDQQGRPWPGAVSFAYPMNSEIMAGITHGPTQAYADLYQEVNQIITGICSQVEITLMDAGYAARALAVSQRSDPANIKGEFPQKTAATRAGLGWVGRNCQLITRKHGPWIRLGTVFTDLIAPEFHPVDQSGCGKCTQCVDACPAGALSGEPWEAGIVREKILDAASCDRWKKENYQAFNGGHNCGICAGVCPFGK